MGRNDHGLGGGGGGGGGGGRNDLGVGAKHQGIRFGA